MMSQFIKSRFATNLTIFGLGMFSVLCIVMIIQSPSLITASLSDAFQNNPSSPYSNYTMQRVTTDTSSSLHSLYDIDTSSNASLRIDMLYNPLVKEVLEQSLGSDFPYSVVYHDDVMTIIIDLSKHRITTGKDIITFSFSSDNKKNIPVLTTITLFDGDKVENISFALSQLSSLYH